MGRRLDVRGVRREAQLARIGLAEDVARRCAGLVVGAAVTEETVASSTRRRGSSSHDTPDVPPLEIVAVAVRARLGLELRIRTVDVEVVVPGRVMRARGRVVRLAARAAPRARESRWHRPSTGAGYRHVGSAAERPALTSVTCAVI